MITSPVGINVPASLSQPRTYFIDLKISPAHREDAWDLCRVALQYGGVEVSDGRFAFADEEQWLMALESLRFHFGPEYFHPVESSEDQNN
jgi:hypothetical protein